MGLEVRVSKPAHFKVYCGGTDQLVSEGEVFQPFVPDLNLKLPIVGELGIEFVRSKKGGI